MVLIKCFSVWFLILKFRKPIARDLGFLASEFHDIRASRVVCMRKCTDAHGVSWNSASVSHGAVSPRPCGNAAEENASRFSPSSFSSFLPRRNEFHANFVHKMPRADCSLSRLITRFARNSDVIRESSGWNFRNAARLFRERTSVCVPRNGALRAVRPRFAADVIELYLWK